MASKKKKAKQTSIQHRPVSIKSLSADNTPLLSIGMIFKNEERCLEKCLQALAPLRKAIPCELVMADTGSTDRSREIAAKYADILFDFPWINDFSAARNAVMDRCSGKWFLTVDADEYLDADFSQLTDFLSSTDSNTYDFATIVIRNYFTADLSIDSSNDFLGLRLMRMATGERYHGRIHEAWNPLDATKVTALVQVVLHHDGYVDEINSHKKGNRNLPLLEAELKDHPDDVRIALLCQRDSYTREQHLKYCHILAELIQKRSKNWEDFGAPALRDMITYGVDNHFPETDTWITLANDTFPNDPFVYVDIAFRSAVYYRNLRNPLRTLEEILRYQKGLSRWETESRRQVTNVLGGLECDIPLFQKRAYILAAEAYANLEQWEDMLDSLRQLQHFEDTERLPNIDLLKSLLYIWKKSNPDMLPLLEILHTFELGSDLKCTVQFLMEDNPATMQALLQTIEDWAAISPAVMAHALTNNIPLPEKFCTLSSRHLQFFAQHTMAVLSSENDVLLSVCQQSAEQKTPAQTIWLYYLANAMLQDCQTEYEIFAQKYAFFLNHAAAYLEMLYHPAILTESNIHLLPQMEQFSWYCLQAQKALDAGALSDCIQYLRTALKSAPQMNPLIQYLLEQIPKEPPKQEPINPELLALAEKIRTILSAFPADDPSVLALKASPVYQQVAHLIENNA